MNKKLSQKTLLKLTFNKHNGGVVFLLFFFLAEMVLLTGTVFLRPANIPPIQIHNINQDNSIQEKAQLFTVKIGAGEFWGSGIIIAQKDNIYRVLTNDHVLSDDLKSYQIITPDRQVYTGKVVADASDFQGNDLAVLEFVTQGKNYSVAMFGRPAKQGDKVFAVGFPIPKLGEKNLGFVFRQGVIWRVLDKPLKDGYQLGYTNEIEKGMSGGALLNEKGEVIAINGMNAYPLLGKPYIYQDGTVPDDGLIEEMVRHSFGIPSDVIPPWIFNIGNGASRLRSITIGNGE